jgi:hypothetical protein
MAVTLCGPRAHADMLVGSFNTGQVLRYDETNGAFLGVFATAPGGGAPVNLALGPDGNLYVSLGPFGTVDLIARFDGNTGQLLGTFGPAASLNSPTGLAFGGDARLYVSTFLDRTAPGAVGKVTRWNPLTGSYLGDFVSPGGGGLESASPRVRARRKSLRRRPR